VNNSPLRALKEIEDARDVPRNPLQSLLKWLDERVPFLLWRHTPFGRLSAEHLLSLRDEAVLTSWRETALPQDFIAEFLALIQRECEWATALFHPADPIRLAVLPPSGEEFPTAMLQLAVKEKFACDVPLSAIESLWCDEQKTLLDLISLIWSRLEETGVRA